MNKLDKDYQELLQDILDNGFEKKDRTGTGTISVFGRQIRHKMSEGFPLLTTKKMPFKTIVTELLWFLRGDTNIKFLVDNNCHIWDGDAYKAYVKYWEPNIEYIDGKAILTQEQFIERIKNDDEFANKWGELGPIYGKQWRKWGGELVTKRIKEEGKFPVSQNVMEGEIDQIQNLINDLKTNPDSRRLMLNSWNCSDLDSMVLPPCHYGFQVYTRELSLEERLDWLNTIKDKNGTFIPKLPHKHLHSLFEKYNVPTRAISLMWNQRSVDTFLGLPFNIASYGLLLEIIAKEVNMVPDELIGNLGDVHLYSNHVEQAKEQIGRELSLYERVDLTNNNDISISYRMGDHSFLETQLDNLNIPKRTREPYPLPTLKFRPCPITGISMEYLSIAQFEIENYQSHPTIKAPLSN